MLGTTHLSATHQFVFVSEFLIELSLGLRALQVALVLRHQRYVKWMTDR